MGRGEGRNCRDGKNLIKVVVYSSENSCPGIAFSKLVDCQGHSALNWQRGFKTCLRTPIYGVRLVFLKEFCVS